jgi:hypothetical protein
MKTPVKYGLYLSAVVLALKLIMSATNTEILYPKSELCVMFLLLVGALVLSIKVTQEKDYKGAGLPTELLKAGLLTSTIFSLVFAIFSMIVKFMQNDLPPSIGQLIFGVVFLFIFILILGGLVSVFISYGMSKRRQQ